MHPVNVVNLRCILCKVFFLINSNNLNVCVF